MQGVTISLKGKITSSSECNTGNKFKTANYLTACHCYYLPFSQANVALCKQTGANPKLILTFLTINLNFVGCLPKLGKQLN